MVPIRTLTRAEAFGPQDENNLFIPGSTRSMLGDEASV